jgi:hypothetical protein
MEDEHAVFMRHVEDDLGFILATATKCEGIALSSSLASSPLRGSVIDYHLHCADEIDEEDEDRCLSSIIASTYLCRNGLSAYLHEAKVIISLGHNSFDAIRKDRWRGSQMNRNLDQQLPLDSAMRPQSLRLHFADPIEIMPRLPVYEHMLWYLQASLRLNVFDSTECVTKLQKQGIWSHWPTQSTMLHP